MDQSKKISIITIVYKVEEYFRQCLDSMIGQTYSNLEIILVLGLKNGKPVDGCSKIAQEYADKDKRIKLVYCEARGPADARNQGLLQVSGDVLAFVDSDDYIEPDMFEVMMKNMQEQQADISVCGRFYEFVNTTKADSGDMLVMGPEDAMKMVLSDDGFFLHCWDKIYSKKVFEGMHFPIDKNVEDRIVVDKLLSKADRIVYDPTPRYHFRERSGSVSKSEGWYKYNIEANEALISFILDKYPTLKDVCDRFYLYEIITCYQNLLTDSKKDTASERMCRDKIKKMSKKIQHNPLIDRRLRIKTMLAIYCPLGLEIITRKNKSNTDAELVRFK